MANKVWGILHQPGQHDHQLAFFWIFIGMEIFNVGYSDISNWTPLFFCPA